MNNINNLILENMHLAEKIAKSKKRSAHSSVSYDELKSAAYLGLTEAANSFDQQFGVPFCLYAFKKIVWSIKTYLRELCWGSRRQPVQVVSFSNQSYRKLFFESFLFFDLDFLDEIQKKILCLKLETHLKNKEIAALMNFSEARISQILSEIKKKIQE